MRKGRASFGIARESDRSDRRGSALVERHRAVLERRAHAAGTAPVIELGDAADSILETEPERRDSVSMGRSRPRVPRP